MAWQVKFLPSALKELSKLPSQTQTRILDYLEFSAQAPRAKGRPMKVGKREQSLWCYRVGNYRVICHLRDDDQTLLAIRLGHRGDVYRGRT